MKFRPKRGAHWPRFASSERNSWREFARLWAERAPRPQRTALVAGAKVGCHLLFSPPNSPQPSNRFNELTHEIEGQINFQSIYLSTETMDVVDQSKIERVLAIQGRGTKSSYIVKQFGSDNTYIVSKADFERPELIKEYHRQRRNHTRALRRKAKSGNRRSVKQRHQLDLCREQSLNCIMCRKQLSEDESISASCNHLAVCIDCANLIDLTAKSVGCDTCKSLFDCCLKMFNQRDLHLITMGAYSVNSDEPTHDENDQENY